MAERSLNRRLTAADFVAARNSEVSIILAELTESTGLVARSWQFAVGSVASDPERALEHLIDAEVRLENHVRLERIDTLNVIRKAIKKLNAELPDDDPARSP
jgi:hypothetical protein